MENTARGRMSGRVIGRVTAKEKRMDKAMLNAREEAVMERAQTWIPRNVRELAAVGGRRAALEVLMSCASELFAEERDGAIFDNSDEAVDALALEARALVGMDEVERFMVFMFNQNKNRVGMHVFEEGSTTRTVLYPRKLFKVAFDTNATGIILVHNHPGGGLKASSQDRDLTRRIQQLGESLEVALMDHLIVTREGHASFRKHGWI